MNIHEQTVYYNLNVLSKSAQHCTARNFRGFRGLAILHKNCSLIRIICYNVAKIKGVASGKRTLCNEMLLEAIPTKYKCLGNFTLYDACILNC